jgi:phosphoglycolate phosphatase
MAHALRAVNRELGTGVDVDAGVRALGEPPRDVLARWVPEDQMDRAMRALASAFITGGLPRVRPLPGAGALLTGLRDAGARVLVVTTRRTRIAAACLRGCGLPVSDLVGDRTPAAKAETLREHRVACYVGDHPLDMSAAACAGVPGVGVLTGFHDAGQLAAAGAGLVLDGLADFPDRPGAGGRPWR